MRTASPGVGERPGGAKDTPAGRSTLWVRSVVWDKVVCWASRAGHVRWSDHAGSRVEWTRLAAHRRGWGRQLRRSEAVCDRLQQGIARSSQADQCPTWTAWSRIRGGRPPAQSGKSNRLWDRLGPPSGGGSEAAQVAGMPWSRKPQCPAASSLPAVECRRPPSRAPAERALGGVGVPTPCANPRQGDRSVPLGWSGRRPER